VRPTLIELRLADYAANGIVEKRIAPTLIGPPQRIVSRGDTPYCL